MRAVRVECVVCHVRAVSTSTPRGTGTVAEGTSGVTPSSSKSAGKPVAKGATGKAEVVGKTVVTGKPEVVGKTAGSPKTAVSPKTAQTGVVAGKAETVGKSAGSPKGKAKAGVSGAGAPAAEVPGVQGAPKSAVSGESVREGDRGVLQANTLLGHPLTPTDRVVTGLQEVYGIGETRARRVCRHFGLIPSMRCGQLTTEQVRAMGAWIQATFRVESDRREELARREAMELSLGTVKSIRKRLGVPVRGQRTKTNGMTAKKLNPTRLGRAR